MKRQSFYNIVLLSLSLFFVGCFSKYIYSDKEVVQHFATKKYKPKFSFTSNKKHTMHYASIGCDTLPLLILIHGAPGAWYGFIDFMSDSSLLAHYKIIAVDRVGYGKSEYGRAELSTMEQASIIAQMIEENNTTKKQVVMLARSYGAPIAAYIAMQHAELVKELIMVSPVIDPKHEKFYWFSKLGKWKVVQWILPKAINMATKEKYAHANEMQQMDSLWGNLTTCTIVLQGRKDWIADTLNYYYADKKLLNCGKQLVFLPDAGHLITIEKPQLIKNILLGL